MRFCICRKFGFLSSLLHNHVVLCTLACRNICTRDIWKQHKIFVHLFVALLHLNLKFLRFLLQGCHQFLCLLRLILLTLLHKHSNLLGLCILLCQNTVKACLSRTSCSISLKNLCHNLLCVKILHSQPFNYKIRLLPQKF